MSAFSIQERTREEFKNGTYPHGSYLFIRDGAWSVHKCPPKLSRVDSIQCGFAYDRDGVSHCFGPLPGIFVSVARPTPQQGDEA